MRELLSAIERIRQPEIHLIIAADQRQFPNGFGLLDSELTDLHAEFLAGAAPRTRNNAIYLLPKHGLPQIEQIRVANAPGRVCSSRKRCAFSS